MNLLQRVRQQYQGMTTPPAKALTHRPDLAGREHLYRQGANTIVQAMDSFADYAAVYSAYGWVQKAISKIAENLASLPVRVVDRNDQAIPGHPLTLLFEHVNDEQTPVDLWSGYVIGMMLAGEAPYQIVPDKRGQPAEIWLRRPDLVSVVPDATRLAYPTAIGYIYEPEEATAQTITIEAPWMAFDKFYNPLNPWRGLAPIHAVREGITIDLFAQAWSKRFLRSNARPDFAIVAPQGITASERDRYMDDFLTKHQGGENAHLPVILEDGVTDIKTFSFPPKDIEWLQQREYARDEVGAIFGVPDEIMGYGKDTYENFQTAMEVFWTLTLLPLIRRRDITLTHHFSRYGLGLQTGQRIATDLSGVGVLQEDSQPKFELARKIWDMGVPLNRIDEMLKLGIGPVPGGELGYLPTSLTTAELVANPPAPPAPVLPPVEPDDEAPDMPDEDMGEMEDDEDEDDAPQVRYVLPAGAKEQARRALKKIIQQYQDGHLRALRTHQLWDWQKPDDTELRRWMGDAADDALLALKFHIIGIGDDHDTVNAAYNALKSDESLAKLLEVEAAAAFFTQRLSIPHGPITHDVYKALLLELDPDDDEAEQRVREEIERRFERELTGAFREQLGDLLPANASDDQIRAAAGRVEATSQPVREILRKELEASSSLGVSVALDTLERIGLGFDWTLANTDAAKWASQYSYELVRGINSTTQARLQVAINDWFQERTTVGDLMKELQPLFGKRRARAIAITETTRAAAQGSIVGFEKSGVVQETQWVTVRDERVCPICGGLHGKRAPLRGTFPEGKSYPPAHPGCRCFVRPVISEAN